MIKYSESKLEEKHFDYFVYCCKKWIEFYGLLDWEIVYFFHEDDGEEGARAMFNCIDVDSKNGSIMLFDSWDCEPSDYMLSRCAYHEVFEVMTTSLYFIAARRDYDPKRQEEETHRLIRIHENAVHDRVWKEHIQPSVKTGDGKGQEISEISEGKELPDGVSGV